MSGEWHEQAITLCRQAAETIRGSGSVRLRTLILLVLIELEQERARRSGGHKGR